MSIKYYFSFENLKTMGILQFVILLCLLLLRLFENILSLLLFANVLANTSAICLLVIYKLLPFSSLLLIFFSWMDLIFYQNSFLGMVELIELLICFL